jgi:transcription-repair coupling factor (superfamily II helicase)
MHSSELREIFSRNSTVKALAVKLQQLPVGEMLYAEGLSGSAASVVLSALPMDASQGGEAERRRHFLVVMNDADEAGYFYGDLVSMLGEEQVMYFPSPYRRGVRYAQIDATNEILRTDVLSRLASLSEGGQDEGAGSFFIVTYPEALAVKVVTRDSLEQKILTVRVGEELNFAGMEATLFDLGFRHVDYVYEPGEFAIRGSILDVYSFSCDLPYRIDFFGDEVDSIRTFDVQSQLSVDKMVSATIVPLVASTAEERVSLFHYLPKGVMLVQRNPQFVAASIERIYAEGFSQQAKIERSEISELHGVESVELSAERILLTGDEYGGQASALPCLVLGSRPGSARGTVVKFHTQPQPLFHKNFDIINQTLADFIQRKYHIYILAENPEQHQRLEAIFEETGANIRFEPVEMALHAGFVDDSLGVCIFTDHQIFDRFHRYQLKAARSQNGKLALSLKDLRQFEPGDYVTHVDHGVGQFVGLVMVDDGQGEQERMKLLYRNGDIVYVSVHSLSKVSKYKSKDGEPPMLSRLGTGAWTTMKERTKSKIKDIARDLIRLYAERRKHKGFAYSPDTFMQHELEASFIYEDTPDQLKITAEIKRDMESPRPMDRLVCGDVGFGKTELAVRAALKAAADGKQVAVLVPTTILAYQHYRTFCERLKDFPVNVAYLSRAQSAKKTKEICELLAEGKIEIIIGTHKLLGKSVRFKDLGLLIIDEEQKFGVATKEKLRQMKVNVDTLTLTATPIPRTLQFSLMGARDLSVLTTPPANRYPIHTEIHTFSHEVIADAINFELSRQGQVFFVCNRISQLPHIESLISQYVPDARVATAHGRLSPDQLEQVVSDFIEGKYDVLLSTTIVENGIDIPNANTIIIDNAQNFGLSDLHQMRGRVGRSTRKAFCYLLTPPLAALSVESRRRLEAIESFSELGSGLQIAMQDLDIRGAGNLLGAEQSGFIADLGYETYQKILSEAVSELKNEEFADLYADEIKHTNDLRGDLFVDDCALESDLPLYLPEDYIPGSSERVQIYREIDSLTTSQQLDAYRLSLQDRFGPLPQPVEGLLKVPMARQTARSLGVERMVAKSGSLTLYFVSNLQSAYYQSETFGRIITYATQHFRTCRLAEHGGRRRLTVEGITAIESLFGVLKEMSGDC